MPSYNNISYEGVRELFPHAFGMCMAVYIYIESWRSGEEAFAYFFSMK
jgi:hypothetical protein